MSGEIFARAPIRFEHAVAFVQNLVLSAPYISMSEIEKKKDVEFLDSLPFTTAHETSTIEQSAIELYSIDLWYLIEYYIKDQIQRDDGIRNLMYLKEYENDETMTKRKLFKKVEYQSCSWNIGPIDKIAIRFERLEEAFIVQIFTFPNMNFVHEECDLAIPLWLQKVILHKEHGDIDHIHKSNFSKFFPLNEKSENFEDVIKRHFGLEENFELSENLTPRFLHNWRLIVLPVEMLLCTEREGPGQRPHPNRVSERPDAMLKILRGASPDCKFARADEPLQSLADLYRSCTSERARTRLRNEELRRAFRYAVQSESLDSRENTQSIMDRGVLEISKPLLRLYAREQGQYNEIVASRFSDLGYYFSNFQKYSESTYAFFIDCGLGSYEKGRIIGQLCDISTYRILSLFHTQAIHLLRVVFADRNVRLNQIVSESTHFFRKEAGRIDSFKRSGLTRRDMAVFDQRMQEIVTIYSQTNKDNENLRGGILYRQMMSDHYFKIIQDRFESIQEKSIEDLLPVKVFIFNHIRPRVKSLLLLSRRYSAILERCRQVMDVVSSSVSAVQGRGNLSIQNFAIMAALVPILAAWIALWDILLHDWQFYKKNRWEAVVVLSALFVFPYGWLYVMRVRRQKIRSFFKERILELKTYLGF